MAYYVIPDSVYDYSSILNLIALTYIVYKIYEFIWNIMYGEEEEEKRVMAEISQEIREEKEKELNPPPVIEPCYPNGWMGVISSHELGKNDVKPVIAFGEELVAFRGKSGNVYVADAFCPHLGANLAYGGQVVNDCGHECIKCPFHDWVYRGSDGIVQNIPDVENTDALYSTAKIKMWEVLEQNGIIYIWYHPSKDSPDWYPTKAEKSYGSRNCSEDFFESDIKQVWDKVANAYKAKTLRLPLFGIETDFGKWVAKFFYVNVNIKSCSKPEKYKFTIESEIELNMFGKKWDKIPVKTEYEGPMNCNTTFTLSNCQFITSSYITPLYLDKTQAIHIGLSTGSIKARLLALLCALGPNRAFGDLTLWNDDRHLRTDHSHEKNEDIGDDVKQWIKQFI